MKFPICDFNGIYDHDLQNILEAAHEFVSNRGGDFVCIALGLNDRIVNMGHVLPEKYMALHDELCTNAGIITTAIMYAAYVNGSEIACDFLNDAIHLENPSARIWWNWVDLHKYPGLEQAVNEALGFPDVNDFRIAWVKEIITDVENRLRNK
jgi:hypothetical protein